MISAVNLFIATFSIVTFSPYPTNAPNVLTVVALLSNVTFSNVTFLNVASLAKPNKPAYSLSVAKLIN